MRYLFLLKVCKVSDIGLSQIQILTRNKEAHVFCLFNPKKVEDQKHIRFQVKGCSLFMVLLTS